MLPSDLSLARTGRARAINQTREDKTASPAHFCPLNAKLTRTENEKGKLHLLRDKATKLPHTAQKRLPFKQFQVLLTPSSGFFSSFPHGTCSLLVSHPYLALDGIYHPFELQSQATRLLEHTPFLPYTNTNGAITLHGGPFQTT